jgi:hypothetical protein
MGEGERTYQVCVGVVALAVLHAFVVDAIELILQASKHTLTNPQLSHTKLKS